GFGDGRAASRLQAVDPGAGVLYREGLRVVDTQPGGRLLAGRRLRELERERRDAGRGDADVQAGTLAVVDFRPFRDPLLADPIGQDDATAAPALGDGLAGRGSIAHGLISKRVGPWAWAFALVAIPVAKVPALELANPAETA